MLLAVDGITFSDSGNRAIPVHLKYGKIIRLRTIFATALFDRLYRAKNGFCHLTRASGDTKIQRDLGVCLTGTRRSRSARPCDGQSRRHPGPRQPSERLGNVFPAVPAVCSGCGPAIPPALPSCRVSDRFPGKELSKTAVFARTSTRSARESSLSVQSRFVPSKKTNPLILAKFWVAKKIVVERRSFFFAG